MEVEQTFLVISVLMLFFDLVLLSRAKPREKRKLEYGFYAATLAFGLIVISCVLFAQAFLNSDFSLIEVYSYSSSNMPWTSKLYASWGGARGSMLFLSLLISTTYFLYRFRTHEKKSTYSIAASRILNIVLIVFLIVTLIKNPFDKLSPVPEEGLGLNPQLQTFWMLAHPPIVFSSYVFVLLAYTLTLAGMETRRSGQPRLLGFSLKAAWLLLTIGIALGGIWAYEVLGWGGYWSWDSVETASLLPWLALTAYFHVGSMSGNGKSLTKETMILTTFASMVFLSALTRGGFTSSVHAYAVSPVGPILLVFALGMTIYFFYLKRRIKQPFFSLEVDKSSIYSVSSFVGYLSLMLIFLVCLFGVLLPIFGRLLVTDFPSTAPSFYNTWSFPFVMVFVVALIGCSFERGFGFRRFTALLTSILIVGIVLTQIQLPTTNALANFGIPLLLLGLAFVTYRLVQAILDKKRSLRLFGRRMLHFGIVITLLGVFISSAAKQTSIVSEVKPDTTLETLGLKIHLLNFSVYNATGQVYSPQIGMTVPEYSALKLEVEVFDGIITHHEELWARLYINYGIVLEPTAVTTLTGDAYLHMDYSQAIYNSLLQAFMGNQITPENVTLIVQTTPLIYLVWAGPALMSIGMALPLIKDAVGSTVEKEGEMISKKTADIGQVEDEVRAD